MGVGGGTCMKKKCMEGEARASRGGHMRVHIEVKGGACKGACA